MPINVVDVVRGRHPFKCIKTEAVEEQSALMVQQQDDVTHREYSDGVSELAASHLGKDWEPTKYNPIGSNG